MFSAKIVMLLAEKLKWKLMIIAFDFNEKGISIGGELFCWHCTEGLRMINCRRSDVLMSELNESSKRFRFVARCSNRSQKPHQLSNGFNVIEIEKIKYKGINQAKDDEREADFHASSDWLHLIITLLRSKFTSEYLIISLFKKIFIIIYSRLYYRLYVHLTLP